MAVLDSILNGVCLLLWLNWRSRGLADLPSAPRIALVGTLKRAERQQPERWPSLVALAVILFARAILYVELGPSTRWAPSLSFGSIALHFRADDFGRMLVFSFLGFALVLAAFYFSLFLVVAANRRIPNNEPWTALIRAHLGNFARLPNWLILIAPFGFGFAFWISFARVFENLDLTVATRSYSRVAEQALVIGLSAWTLLQYVIGAVLILYILSTYIYLGSAPFWNFIALTGRNLLRPISVLPLRFGKIDFIPMFALGLIVGFAVYAPRGLGWLYAKVGI